MHYFTYATIAVTSIISYFGFTNPDIIKKYMFSVTRILHNKEWYRIATSQFFHGNWAHLLFNMFSFYSFAHSMEMQFGIKIVAVIYLYSAIGGDLLALAIKRRVPDYSAIGASGAVSGIIFSSIFLIPGGEIFIFPIPLPIPDWIFAVLFLLISLYGIGKNNSFIGHEAHLGGALTGIIWAALYRPSIIETNLPLLCALTIPIIALLLVSIFKPELIHFNNSRK